MADFDIVVEKLHSFENADDLADYFRQYGVLAKPQEARSCAISVFVGIETGETGNVITSTREITIQETILDHDGDFYQVDRGAIQHTHTMVEFVRNFDTGKYPFLVEEGYEYDTAIDVESSLYCYCKECRPGDDY